MNSIHPDGPTPEALARASIEWIEAKRHERADPVPRKTGLHVALLKADMISKAHYVWAERYAEETERLAGAKPGRSDVERVDHSTGPLVYHRRAQAATWLRGPHSRLTLRQRHLLRAACVQCFRICDIAVVIGVHPIDDETMEQFAKRVDERIRRYTTQAIIVGSGIKDRD